MFYQAFATIGVMEKLEKKVAEGEVAQ